MSRLDKLQAVLAKGKDDINREETEKKREAIRQEEEQYREEVRQRERQFLQDRLQSELEITEKKLEMERAARATQAKLPKLTITAFKGTASDWVRFENMFLTQVDCKPITDEEKFGYLLEMVSGKVRDKISNLKPGSVGYKTAWERLKKEYGQTRLVVNSHIDEIVNLDAVKGKSYEQVQAFYDRLSANYDALRTLDEHAKLDGFVMCTLNKLPQVKPDLVRTDDDWEEWSMENLIDNIQSWLRRNKSSHDHHKRERNMFSRRGGNKDGKRIAQCVFCKSDHWSDKCKSYVTAEQRKKFFVENKLCFNCASPGHRGNECCSRGCFHCGAKHHTSLCTQEKNHLPPPNDGKGTVLTGYTSTVEEPTLPAIIPVKLKGEVFWAFLDTDSGRNFISREAAKKLNLQPVRHETKEIITVNSSTKQSMPIFAVMMESMDGNAREEIELTGSKLNDFTTVRRPDMNKLKLEFEHTKDKRFYMNLEGKYPIHMILGDKTYCRIRTEEVFKGNPGDPVVEGSTFGWIIHGGNYSSEQCMFTRETSDYEKLYSLDVLGVEDRGENDQLDVLRDFQETITKTREGRYEVGVPWVPGTVLSNNNLEPSRKRLDNVWKRISRDKDLKEEYEEIVVDQLNEGIVERAPEQPTGERLFYMPHKPVVKQDATTTKVRMVFDASMKPHPIVNSVNDCMFTGPPLQPLLWDIMVRARVACNILLADIYSEGIPTSWDQRRRPGRLPVPVQHQRERRASTIYNSAIWGRSKPIHARSNDTTPSRSTTSRV